MTIRHLYPAAEPSLNLDFANSKSLDPRITFTRASIGTYLDPDTQLIKTAADDEARIEKEGLLLEESRTNLLTYSEEFDNVDWSKTGTTVTANTTAAPDGTTTADTLTKTVSTGFTEQGSIAVSSGVSYTYSVFAKANSLTWLALRTVAGFTDDYFYFNLSTGTIGQSATQGTQSIQKIPNGWYRCSVTATTTATTCGVRIYGATADENPGGTGDIYIWGAQLEAGAFPTSYIPTDGTPGGIIRSADIASMTGTNFSSWYNPGDGSGTMVTEYDGVYNSPWTVGLSNFPRWICGWFDNRVQIYDGTNATAVTFPGNYPTISSKTKEAVGLDSTTMSAARNGLVNTSSHTATITGLYGTQRLDIGYTSNIFRQVNGHISRLTYYPTRLTDAQLEALTL